MQAKSATSGDLIYFDFEQITAINVKSNKVYLKSGLFLTLDDGETENIYRKMLRAGMIAGLGANAEETQHYPYALQ